MNAIYKGPERRKAPRTRVGFFVTLKVSRLVETNISLDDREINAQMLDLSELGMAVLTNYAIPLWSTLWIRFTLMNLYADKDQRVRPMEVTGEVRNYNLLENNTIRLGICFIRIAEEDKRSISDYVKMALKQ